MRKILIAGTVALSACSAVQQSRLVTACNDAMAVANIAGLVPGVGAIVPYITAGCATAEGLTKLASDPSSEAWLAGLRTKILSLAGR